MPLFDYECNDCKLNFERILPMDEYDKPQNCPNCGQIADKIVVLGHGGIRRPDSTWIRSINDVFNKDELKRPLENISDLRTFLAENPNIRPKESHPSLPSSLGDGMSPPDPKEQKRQRLKTATKTLSDMRRITVSGQATA